MTLEQFWFTPGPDYLYPDDNPLGIFTLPHLIWVLITLVLGIIYVRAYLKGNGKRRSNMRYGMAVFMLFSEIFKICLMTVQNAPADEFLPLEFCSLSEYLILLDSMWPDKTLTKQMMAFAQMPAALMAVLFPAIVCYPALCFVTIRYFLFHAGIVIYVIARYAAGEIDPKYRGIWTSLPICLVIGIFMQRFDLAFGYNFMFMVWHNGNPVLKLIWDAAGGRGGIPYIIAFTVFTCIVMHVSYFVYRAISAKRKKA